MHYEFRGRFLFTGQSAVILSSQSISLALCLEWLGRAWWRLLDGKCSNISKAPVSVARLDNSVWKARHEAKLQEQPEIAGGGEHFVATAVR
jgi:hypothetical protein